MGTEDEKIEVENVNVPGRTTRVNKAMYLAMKMAMWKVLPTTSPGMTQADISEAILKFLPDELYPAGEKSMWWAKTVQLDLEAKGKIIREQTKPLRWYRVKD